MQTAENDVNVSKTRNEVGGGGEGGGLYEIINAPTIRYHRSQRQHLSIDRGYVIVCSRNSDLTGKGISKIAADQKRWHSKQL